jgi:hypothetical protein
MRALTSAMAFVLFAALSLAQSVPEAREGDSVAWHTVQPGETLSSITFKYLGDATLWPENQRLNPGIGDPDKLTPGQKVRVITAREIAARHAKVDKLSRKVDKKLQQESWLTAKLGDQLVEREGLRTYESSSAELGLDDGTRLQMTENSIVFLREYKASLRKVDRSRIEVVEGGVDLAVAPLKPREKRQVEVLIGDVQARPKASNTTTQARARRDTETKSAKLMVYAGATEVESAGVKVQVPKGMGTSVAEGAAPAAPQKLLAAPGLVAPADGTKSRGATEFSWAAVPNAASYIVEVCRDEKCGDLAARQVGVNATKTAFATLPPGNLFWRVTARSKGGLDGFPSKPRSLAMAREISGRVMLDPTAAGSAASWVPIAGAAVRMYADNGDGVPGGGDELRGETRSDASGAFALDGGADGVWWLAIDSRSASPAGGWREQTWGPAGSLCADGKGGTSLRESAGFCYGGRRGGVSDYFDRLDGAEHLAKLVLNDAAILSGLDFAFSGGAVTTVADADPAPQGSLRAFLLDATASPNDRTMRFVPAEAPNGGAGSASWWRIALAAPLPPLPEGALVDGKAWSLAGEAIDSNPGNLGSAETVGVDAVALKNPSRPELEVSGEMKVDSVFTSAGSSAIANLGITGANRQQVVAVGALSIENSLVGVNPDGTVPTEGSQIGIDATGDLTLSRVLVSGQSVIAVRVLSEEGKAKLRARDLEAIGCGAWPALQVRSSGAEIVNSLVRRCENSASGPGIEFQGRSVALGSICRNHKVTGSTIRGFDDGIVLRLGAMDNVIEGNVIDAPGRGIMFQHLQSFWTPKGNRISRNRWVGGGEPISLEGLPGLGFEKVKLYELAVSCGMSGTSVDRALDFMGVGSIKREAGGLRVTGTVCPEATVEVYARGEGRIEYLGSVKGDAAGAVDGFVATDGAPPRDLAGITIDKSGTTSRMKFGSVK